MDVIAIKHIEDCFDGSFIQEFILNEPITEAFIRFLGQQGQLQYYPSFARPFFKIVFKGDFYIKGVQGNTTMRALLWKKENVAYLQRLVTDFIGS